MSRWADFCISAVRFNKEHTHIDRVQARPDNVDTVGAPEDHMRADIIAGIKRQKTYITIFDNNGKWKKGQPVEIVKINGIEYLKTLPNNKAVDNLDNLPEY